MRELVTTTSQLDQIDQIAAIGQAANEAAAKAAFEVYRIDRAENTLSAQKRALKHFAAFLTDFGIPTTKDELWKSPEAWGRVTWGLIEGHKIKSLNDGASISAVNQRLSVIKVYSRLAHKGGFLSTEEMIKIETIKSIRGKKARQNANERRGYESPQNANTLTSHEVRALRRELAQDHTPRGKRDQLLFQVLFEHGLRASEVLKLGRGSFGEGCIVFDRQKTGATGCVHYTRQPTRDAFAAYLSEIGHKGPFWQSTRKGGTLTGNALVRSSLDRAVRRWGRLIGIEDLSAHDARHTLATKLARDGMTANDLMDFFGWSSLSTAQRYIERRKVGNEGVGSIW